MDIAFLCLSFGLAPSFERLDRLLAFEVLFAFPDCKNSSFLIPCGG
uniref:Uncharacterized protein n=1 Tax=Utricularia reniformis TaxID=192314 RepID=A0A1Y0B292_9LAMI|nr:hypothetical protein AEK19_MT1310 [Utricularia reniformis]ART31511.1 hypothetical protein AEK19_MT1310 [Utricularia reniformis]